MKKLNNYITERLKLTSKTSQYSCQPKDKFELREILEERLKKDKNADLNDIDVSEITDMGTNGFPNNKGLFENLNPHNIDISEWDVSNVTNMSGVFYGCENFNCDLSEWNVSKVIDMRAMFINCYVFTGKGLEKWNVSKVINMRFMFFWCKKFNCDLNNWNVGNVTDMENIFIGCDSLQNKPNWYNK